MKRFVILSMVTALPFSLMAQSDDLYFVPKKQTESKTTEAASTRKSTTTVPTVGEVRFNASGKSVYKATKEADEMVMDANGKLRDVDEYNRRYSFAPSETVEEEQYVTEEEVETDGEWMNGFDGTEEDYEYATRLIRFRSPRVAVPVSSPLYWDIVYSWPISDWNVYSDGMYAYAFPTVSNPLWIDWRFDPWRWNYGFHWNLGFGFSFGWHSDWYDPWHYDPWYYSSWHNPWHHHHHHHPHYGGGWFPGGHIGGSPHFGNHYYDNRARLASRPVNAVRGNRHQDGSNRNGTSVSSRVNRGNTTVDSRNAATRNHEGRRVNARSTDNAVRTNTSANRSSGGRSFTIGDTNSGRSKSNSTVNRGNNTAGSREGTTVTRQNSSSSRQQATSRQNKSGRSSTYTRTSSVSSKRTSGTDYSRPSSTRSTSRSSGSSYSNSSRSTSRSSGSSYSNGSRSTSRSSGSSYSSGGSSSRSSFSGGGSSSSSRSGGGGSRGGRR